MLHHLKESQQSLGHPKSLYDWGMLKDAQICCEYRLRVSSRWCCFLRRTKRPSEEFPWSFIGFRDPLWTLLSCWWSHSLSKLRFCRFGFHFCLWLSICRKLSPSSRISNRFSLLFRTHYSWHRSRFSETFCLSFCRKWLCVSQKRVKSLSQCFVQSGIHDSFAACLSSFWILSWE